MSSTMRVMVGLADVDVEGAASVEDHRWAPKAALE